jgi:nitrate reductase delta subunit
MKEDQIKIFKIISILLQYPDNALLRYVPELESHVEQMPSSKAKSAIKEFLMYLKYQPMIRLQENYTAAFDMNPSTTLNMTYHLYGDGEKRAATMARLQQVYFDAGYECIADELPDFLPLMLEFSAECPSTTNIDLFLHCSAGLDGLVNRLQKMAQPYAALLGILADDWK